MAACSDCVFDVINIHHYVPRSDCTVDIAVAALKKYIDIDVPAIQAKHPQLRDLPLCIGEVRWSPFSFSDDGKVEFQANAFIPWV